MNWNSHQFIWLDWVIIAAGIIGVTWAVWRSIQKDKKTMQGANSEDYLFGKGEPWYIIGMAIFAANIGSEHLVGLAGTGAKSGVGMAHWEMQGWMILVLGWLFVPFYQLLNIKWVNHHHARLPEISLYSANRLVVVYHYPYCIRTDQSECHSLYRRYLPGKFAGTSILVWCHRTDCTDWYLHCIGRYERSDDTVGYPDSNPYYRFILVLFLGLSALGNGSIAEGWSNLIAFANTQNVGADGVAYGTNHVFHFNENDPMYHEYPGFITFIGASIIGFWYWCTDQHIVQRVLGQTKGEANDVVMARARRGTIAAGYFKILPVFMFLIPGMIAAALSQQPESGFILDNPDTAFGNMVKFVLPAGVKGIVTIGFISALVASLAAFFNSCATLFTEDFYKPMYKGKSESTYVLVGRIATIVVVILGIVWIPVMQSLGSLYDYLQGIQSLLAPTMVAVFFLGIFFKNITPKAGEWTMIGGFIIGMVRLITNVITNTGSKEMTGWMWESTTWFWKTNWLVFEVWLLVFLVIFMFAVSAFTPRPTQSQIEAISFTADYKEQIRKSWNIWDVIATLGVVALCAAFYAYFW